MDGSQPLDPRKTVFVGGVPRPLRAGIFTKTFVSLLSYFLLLVIAVLQKTFSVYYFGLIVLEKVGKKLICRRESVPYASVDPVCASFWSHQM